MFDTVPAAPADAILGLTEAFLRDDRAGKINLGAGVYKDESGSTPVLRSVKEAERRILDQEPSKAYLPIEGGRDYRCRIERLVLGADEPAIAGGRIATVHTPGGTGALRVGLDFLERIHPAAKVWLSDPTWANHPQIVEAAGLGRRTYRYFDSATDDLDLDGMLADLESAASGDVVVLHGCCHNPTGVDPDLEQWRRIATLLAERELLPLVDLAYQGFAAGVEEDAAGVRLLASVLPEMVVATSASKSFALYNERVGALAIKARSPEIAAAVFSQVKRCVRTSYSNPPAHGGAIVATILGDPELRRLWEDELAAMRSRIREMRSLFRRALDERGVALSPLGNGFVERQRGMFSFTHLDPTQVRRLRDEQGVYLVGSGRINVAGITRDNAERLADAIATVC